MTYFNHKILLFVVTSLLLSNSFSFAAEFDDDDLKRAIEASNASYAEEERLRDLLVQTKVDDVPRADKPLATPVAAAPRQINPFQPLEVEQKAQEKVPLSAADKIRARRALQRANQGGPIGSAQAAFVNPRLEERAGAYDFPVFPLPITTQPVMAPLFTGQLPIVPQPAPQIMPQPLPQKEAGPVMISEELKVLATYIVARRGAIRSTLNNVFDEYLQFVEHPFCAALNGPLKLDKDPLKLGNVKMQAHEDFVRFCADKNFNLEVARPLFTYFWDQILTHRSINTFMETYTQLFALVMNPQTKLQETLSKAVDYEGEGTFKQLLNTSGFIPLYGQLQAQKEAIFNKELTTMTPEWLIAQSPRIDLIDLLKVQKAAAQVHIPQRVEEKKPEFIVRPLLSPAISECLKDLSQQFEMRKRGNLGDPEETVMIYGNITAKNYYLRLEEHLNNLWMSFNLAEGKLLAQPKILVKSIEEIKALHEEVKAQLEHKDDHLKIVKGVLDESLKRHNTPLQHLTVYLTHERTQYDYLLMVASHVLQYYQVVKETNPNAAYALVGIFFNALIEQQGRCQAGMVGRLLIVHTTALDMLVDYYYHTPNK